MHLLDTNILSELDFVRLRSDAEGLRHSYDAGWWDILCFPVWRGALINVAGPEKGAQRRLRR